MPISRTYSLLHEQPAFPMVILDRFLGIGETPIHSTPLSSDEPGCSENRIAEQDNCSMTTTEFFADMEVERSEIDSIYEVCGALINEGFTVPSNNNDDEEEGEGLDWDTPSSRTLRSSTPSSSSLSSSSVQQAVSFDAVTGLPIPPFIVCNYTPPMPAVRISCYDASPEGYTHLDPTRPNPYMQYPCQWDRTCLRRVRGSSPGHMQWHLRQVHRMNDRVNKLVRCEHFIHQRGRVCGAEVPIKELGMHICDVHWSSRRVRCPFCGYWQITRDDVPDHWLQSCPEYASASEEEQEAWKQFWKWPARGWLKSH